MKKCILLFVLGIFLLSSELQAQQEQQFTQFMHNKLNLNPAYAGAPGVLELQALYRNQWMGFSGNPESILLSFNSSLLKDKVGIGLTLANYNVGIYNNYVGAMAYSYNVAFSEKANLRIGLQVAAKRYEIDFNAESIEQNRPLIQSGDVFVGDQMEVDDFVANFGAGAYLEIGDAYIGLSVPNLYNSQIIINDDLDAQVEETQHFYGMAGVDIPLSDNLVLQPNVLAKYVQDAPFDLDGNLMLLINDIVGVGASYRLGGQGSGESVDFLVMFKAGNIMLGAAYDLTMTDIQDYSTGSFEALIRYSPAKKEAQNLENPRFFE